jgi:Ca-activated chloride channel homolog
VRFAFDFRNLYWLFGLFAVAWAALGFAAWFQERKRAALTRAIGETLQVNKLIPLPFRAVRTLKIGTFFTAVSVLLLAIARPAFDTGEKMVPATKLDIVVVLDYSKSMYARDVTPSRTARAKAEVSDLIRRIPRARFGAVAFAGEPMSFPLTSDGSAIAHFFSELTPNDMPVGGTATARALGRARELFERDPRSKDHERAIVLITDGEDLEGDPLAVAEACKTDGTKIHVVQIGSNAPVPVPELDESGNVIGTRKGLRGAPMTTQLSQEGLEQLRQIAEATGGRLVRSDAGQTGIETLGTDLAQRAEFELAERVEVLYDERYAYPLGFAILLLLLEALYPETRGTASGTKTKQTHRARFFARREKQG